MRRVGESCRASSTLRGQLDLRLQLVVVELLGAREEEELRPNGQE